jgi:hypothetical protein
MMEKKDNPKAEVIDIMPHIKNRKLKNAVQQEEPIDLESDLSEFIELMELATDDIAGTLVARHVYSVDLLPGISSEDLMKELKIRIQHHSQLLQDLEDKLQ